MSHSDGTVTFKDEEVLHFEYDGTCDVVVPELYKTSEEMLENWRRGSRDTCGCEGEEVVIHTTYGEGFEWEGRACREHMRITSGRDPFEHEYSEIQYPFGR